MRVPTSICPSCSAPNDGAQQINGRQMPRPGDVSICFYCGELGIFNSDLSLRAPSVAELEIMRRDPEIMLVLRVRQREIGNETYPPSWHGRK